MVAGPSIDSLAIAGFPRIQQLFGSSSAFRTAPRGPAAVKTPKLAVWESRTEGWAALGSLICLGEFYGLWMWMVWISILVNGSKPFKWPFANGSMVGLVDISNYFMGWTETKKHHWDGTTLQVIVWVNMEHVGIDVGKQFDLLSSHHDCFLPFISCFCFTKEWWNLVFCGIWQDTLVKKQSTIWTWPCNMVFLLA